MKLAQGDVLVLRLMSLEALAALVTERLRAAGVDVLLVKGPVTNRWLYGGAHSRAYGDVDILVRPSQAACADDLLLALGFEDLHARLLAIHRPSHERAWARGGLVLDVHTRLAGIPRDRAEHAFDVLWQCRELFDLPGTVATVLAPVDRAVHLALHAAQSPADSRALRDLERGLAQLPSSLWCTALQRADDLGCASAVCFGLGKLPAGQELLDSAGVAVAPTVEVLLRSGSDWSEVLNLWEALTVHPRRRVPAALMALQVFQRSVRVPVRDRLSAAARGLASPWFVSAAVGRRLTWHPVTSPQ